MYREQTRKSLIEEIKKIAEACTTVSEAEELYYNAPSRSETQKIYRKHWEELANAEAVAMVAACKTAAEAKELYDDAPSESEARKIYGECWM
ncbi:MAG: hypothetical protein AAB653_03795, partial [Patescibacteria group bacterium]